MYSLYLLLFYSTINFNLAIIQAILPQAVLSGFGVHLASHVSQLVIASSRYVPSSHGSEIITLKLANRYCISTVQMCYKMCYKLDIPRFFGRIITTQTLAVLFSYHEFAFLILSLIWRLILIPP